MYMDDSSTERISVILGRGLNIHDVLYVALTVYANFAVISSSTYFVYFYLH